LDPFACDNLSQHNNQNVATLKDGRQVKISNCCPECGWFAPTRREWPKWNGTLPQNFLQSLGHEKDKLVIRPEAASNLLHGEAGGPRVYIVVMSFNNRRPSNEDIQTFWFKPAMTSVKTCLAASDPEGGSNAQYNWLTRGFVGESPQHVILEQLRQHGEKLNFLCVCIYIPPPLRLLLLLLLRLNLILTHI